MGRKVDFKTKEKKGPGRKTKKQKEPEFLSEEFKVRHCSKAGSELRGGGLW